MTNETKHTPTPWDHINGVYTQENGYFSMVQTPDKCVADVFDKEDAAHIVKCVNMHDELVEVLSKFMDFRNSDYVPNNMFKRAEEALKKAGAL